MSKELVIDGVRFESSASIAQRFNYTQDYVGRLAREGKVVGTKVGRFWFVDVASFTKFLESVEEEKQQRAIALRAERQQERDRVQQSQAVPQATPDPEKEVAAQPSPYHTQYTALAQAVAVVVCGLLVGTIGWSAQGLQLAHIIQGSSAMASQLQEVFAMADMQVFSDELEQSQAAMVVSPASPAGAPEVFTTLPASPVVATSTVKAANDSNDTVSSLPFSDQVQLVREEDGVQIVRPVFSEADEQVEYRVTVESVTNDDR